jgi:hypothetical protein
MSGWEYPSGANPTRWFSAERPLKYVVFVRRFPLNQDLCLEPERVVSETDGPYAKIAGRASQPSDIPQTVLALARTWNEEPDEARARICATMAALAQPARTGGDATSTSRDDQTWWPS